MKSEAQTQAIENGTDWVLSTKEMLNPAKLLVGLLDHGLFSEKIPPCFTSVGLAEIAALEKASVFSETEEDTLKKAIKKCSHDFIRYASIKESNVPRHFGIPHPESYAIQCLGIEKNWKLIAEHCNKPSPVASRIYVRQQGNARVFEMNYKGDDRYEFEESGIKQQTGMKYVVKADISSCFPSIYTHSIPWALHGKPEAKQAGGNITKLVGNLLDNLAQATRDKQTNGLLIGPHSSNLLSEIVLTSVDVMLQEKGHKKFTRHIDDYTFYAATFVEAETFIRNLGLSLRAYEMNLNDTKTQILKLPRPSQESWVQTLKRYVFSEGDVTYSDIRAYLDVALQCVNVYGKSTPLKYAIKMLSNKGKTPRKLNERAKRMYVQEAMNLAIAYPYLVPVLDRHVFDVYHHPTLSKEISGFSKQILDVGVEKLYPETIAYAIYYALKYEVALSVKEQILLDIVSLDDCLTNVLLFEYAKLHRLKDVTKAILAKSEALKKVGKREQDQHWLLIYQLWTEQDLSGNSQSFLANLKRKNFVFLKIPTASSIKGQATITLP